MLSAMSSLFRKFTMSGVSDTLSFEEVKRVKLLNSCLFISIPYTTFFFFINLLNKHYLPATFNLLIIIGGLGIYYINRSHRYIIARVILSSMGTVLFFSSGILFNGGAEYFLLLSICLVMMLFENKWFVYTLSIINATLFLLSQTLFANKLHVEELPATRIIFNLGSMLTLFILSLRNFKWEHIIHQTKYERKNTDLEESNKALAILNESKEKLISIIAHDMRSPIASLRTSLDLVQADVISKADFTEIARQLVLQVDHLQESMDNLLHWSLSQLKGITIHTEVFLPAEEIRNTLKLFEENIHLKQLQVNLVIPEDIQITADINHFKIIFRNILSNAIKYSYTKEAISIEMKRVYDKVRIVIADQGMGLSQEQLQAMKDGTISYSERGTLNEKGTGLGLMLTREFAERNNGGIYIATNEPRGCKVTIELPAA